MSTQKQRHWKVENEFAQLESPWKATEEKALEVINCRGLVDRVPQEEGEIAWLCIGD
ncbi:UNVERIFIED_CONTAM: hypothetical protein Sangu_2803700 [Sesamum angustifolium]|uniref:Uncharacterized protein n=1 Tax=Sesamum angustifolium TaxID=2727405 RepID=A0AAW2IT24_9LAMI